jgi:hypothetical protein
VDKEKKMTDDTQSSEHYDEEDVAAALERETDDGPGDEEPGEGDFQSYATEGVEQEGTQ